jgi:hypothetical protein
MAVVGNGFAVFGDWDIDQRRALAELIVDFRGPHARRGNARVLPDHGANLIALPQPVHESVEVQLVERALVFFQGHRPHPPVVRNRRAFLIAEAQRRLAQVAGSGNGNPQGLAEGAANQRRERLRIDAALRDPGKEQQRGERVCREIKFSFHGFSSSCLSEIDSHMPDVAHAAVLHSHLAELELKLRAVLQ